MRDRDCRCHGPCRARKPSLPPTEADQAARKVASTPAEHVVAGTDGPSAERLLQLQRSVGNQAVSRMLGRLTVQRAAKWANGNRIRTRNPAAEFAAFNFSLGFTPPVLNGTEVHGGNADALAQQAIVAPGWRRQPEGAGFVAKVTSDPVNTVSYNMYLPAPPPWRVQSTVATVLPLLKMEEKEPCDGVNGAVDFEFLGRPNAPTFLRNLERHESQHAKDHEQAFKQILKPWADKIWWRYKLGSKAQGATPD
ncbi:MAG: hypothetical protein QOI99_1507, partial [Actinomycetota bacterium]|nr:hypothetical protein [Actinomycetota bacterium]